MYHKLHHLQCTMHDVVDSMEDYSSDELKKHADELSAAADMVDTWIKGLIREEQERKNAKT
jgi:hypothetical protein